MPGGSKDGGSHRRSPAVRRHLHVAWLRPKKLLWTVTDSVDQARRFTDAGFRGTDIHLSWLDLMHFKRSFLDAAPEAVEKRLRSPGIDTFHGAARFGDRTAVLVDGERLESRFIAMAAGSNPSKLPVSGAEDLLTSDDFPELDHLTDSIAFVGGGYISFEFAHIAARVGVVVAILHEDDRPLTQFDRDLVERVFEKSRRIGIDIRLNSRVDRIEPVASGFGIYANGRRVNEAAEAGLVVSGAGRVPDIDDLDLDAAGIEREGHRLRLTPCPQSVSNPAVYAAGDAAASAPMLTPVSEIDGEVVAQNPLAGAPRHAPDYHGVPSVVFTIPPVASVGLTEQEARDRNLNFRFQQADISGWYSARRVQEDTAAFKILFETRCPHHRRRRGRSDQPVRARGPPGAQGTRSSPVRSGLRQRARTWHTCSNEDFFMRPQQGRSQIEAADTLVELASEQSFPASDPPSRTSARIGGPADHGRTDVSDTAYRVAHALAEARLYHGRNDMSETIYPASSSTIRHERRELAPDIHAAWDAFSQRVFADGALPAKTKQLIAVAVAHVTQCPYCIKGHTQAALRHDATPQELMEAIWVAAEMRAGGAFAHSTVALTEIDEVQQAGRP